MLPFPDSPQLPHLHPWMRLGGRGLDGMGRVGGGEIYAKGVAGESALLLDGQERVAGGVLVACYVGSHPGTQ